MPETQAFRNLVLQAAADAIWDHTNGDLPQALEDPTTVPPCTAPAHEWPRPVDAASRCPHCNYQLTLGPT